MYLYTYILCIPIYIYIVDEMGNRIDDLEGSIGELMQQVQCVCVCVNKYIYVCIVYVYCVYMYSGLYSVYMV